MDEEKVYCSMYSRNAELYHHGIDGQKWGIRNGPPYPLGSDVSTGSRLKNGSLKEDKNELKQEKKALKNMDYSHYKYEVDGHRIYADRKIYDGSSGKTKVRVVTPEESLKMKRKEISDVKEIIKNKNKIVSEISHNKKFLDEINSYLSFFSEEDKMPKITSSNFLKYFSLDDAFSVDYFNGDISKPFYGGTMDCNLHSELYLSYNLTEDKKKPFEIEMVLM